MHVTCTQKREALVGRDVTVQYDRRSFAPKGRQAVLDDRHSHFLLVDDGSVGR